MKEFIKITVEKYDRLKSKELELKNVKEHVLMQFNTSETTVGPVQVRTIDEATLILLERIELLEIELLENVNQLRTNDLEK